MKKKIIYFIMLLCFFTFKNVYAEDIDITDMELTDKSATAVEKTPATFEGLNTYFDIQFANVDDYIEYTVTLKNNSATDYVIDEGNQFDNGGNVRYSFELDGDDDVILAGATRTGRLVVAYIKKVDTDSFVDGVYTTSSSLQLLLSSNTKDANITNPKTCRNLAILMVVLIVAVVAVLTLKKKSKILSLLLVALLAYPIYVVCAYEKLYIMVNPKIEILVPIREICVAEEYDEETNKFEEIQYFEYQEGMTWDSYANSEEYFNEWFLWYGFDPGLGEDRNFLDYPNKFVDTVKGGHEELVFDGHNDKYNSSIPSGKIRPKEEGCYVYNIYVVSDGNSE